MIRGLKDIADLLLRVLRGGEVSVTELMDLGLVAQNELRAALLHAHVSLFEFAQQRDLRSRDAAADRAMRAQLEMCLERIADACDRVSTAPGPARTLH